MNARRRCLAASAAWPLLAWKGGWRVQANPLAVGTNDDVWLTAVR